METNLQPPDFKHFGLTLLFFFFSLVLLSQNLQDVEPKEEYPGIFDVFGEEVKMESSSFNFCFLNKRLFLALSEKELGKDFLLVKDKEGQKFFRWGKLRDNISLVASNVNSQANSVIEPFPKKRGIQNLQEPIIAVFPILAKSNESQYLIEITSIFLNAFGGFPEISANIDRKRSFISEVRGFSNSIEINAIQTIPGGSGNPPQTLSSHWSIYKLPAILMESRIFDPRMGYFMDEFRGNNYTFKNKTAIIRWSLKKKYPAREKSEPVKPILFYLDPKIPEKWVPYVKEGLLAWNKAFYAAGFENAIQIGNLSENAHIKLGDMNYSFVRWEGDSLKRKFKKPRASVGGGGSASKVIDWRSGEILKGDIIIWSPTHYLRDRYFLRAGAFDPRARNFPYPDSLMGKLIKSLISHETGHALGLKDGNYGEFAYPFEEMRSIEWLRKMGHTPSIMNYTREHGLIQETDTIPLDLVFQDIGPADIHHIKWGYTDFGDLPMKVQSEKLDSIIRRADELPWLRYAQSSDHNGPYGDHEVADNDQPVASSYLALANLKKLMRLLPGIALKKSADNFLLEHLYFQILNQWVWEMKHLNSVIGGYNLHYKFSHQPGPIYNPIPFEEQKEALKVLIKEAFETPGWMIRKDITHRFEAKGMITNINSLQNQVLTDLLSESRINRIIEQEDIDENNGRMLPLFLNELNAQLWKELEKEKISIDVYRQELQKSYLKHIANLLKSKTEISGIYERVLGLHHFPAYAEGIIHGILEDLKFKLDKNIKNSDQSTYGHLKRVRKLILKILDEKERVSTI